MHFTDPDPHDWGKTEFAIICFVLLLLMLGTMKWFG